MQVRMILAAAGVALSAAACATPSVDSFCEKFRAKDFTDRGLRAQNKANQEADLVNERTRKRDCVKEGAR